MVDFYRWGDLPKRAATFLVAVPATVAFILLAPAWIFAGLVLFALAIAVQEILAMVRGRRRGPVRDALVFLGASVYCLVLGSFLVRLYAAGPDGPAWVVFLLAVCWGGDVGGYLVGHAWGRRKLCPSVSPGKTVEGSVGSLVLGSGLGLVAWWALLGEVGFGLILMAAVVGNLLSQAGDLVESAVKRWHGVKDSGMFLPGQGGMLDILDGVLLAGWWVWLVRGMAG